MGQEISVQEQLGEEEGGGRVACILVNTAGETQASEIRKQAFYSEQSERHLLEARRRSI